MKQATRDWIDKAEDDLLLARQSLASSRPVYDGICFHAQQCVEKYLNALLEEHRIAQPHSHDLPDLAARIGGLVPHLMHLAADLEWLTIHAVETRYPGRSATPADAARAMQIAFEVRKIIRNAFALTGDEKTEGL